MAAKGRRKVEGPLGGLAHTVGRCKDHLRKRNKATKMRPQDRQHGRQEGGKWKLADSANGGPTRGICSKSGKEQEQCAQAQHSHQNVRLSHPPVQATMAARRLGNGSWEAEKMKAPLGGFAEKAAQRLERARAQDLVNLVPPPPLECKTLGGFWSPGGGRRGKNLLGIQKKISHAL